MSKLLKKRGLQSLSSQWMFTLIYALSAQSIALELMLISNWMFVIGLLLIRFLAIMASGKMNSVIILHFVVKD